MTGLVADSGDGEEVVSIRPGGATSFSDEITTRCTATDIDPPLSFGASCCKIAYTENDGNWCFCAANNCSKAIHFPYPKKSGGYYGKCCT
ncbi:hypothetical protein L6452_24021 [Arctium lappa]|uniref:Uncharacterized protein n=1 Tax=Arctium lappa TaxID=4217 RepID=A0ACB9A8A0_ARCLA|nr:hypothetical protein L6452_24021 [Arctium lappa]